MSLLSDLALAYETLADDPIEMGIHYGKSVLKVLSGTTKQAEASLRNSLPSPAVRSNIAVRSRRAPRVQAAAPRQAATTRRDYSAVYNIRPRAAIVSRQSPARAMVGAI